MDNHADRLYRVLRKAKESSSVITSLVWKDALDLADSDIYQVIYHLVLLRQLLDEVEKQVRVIPNMKHDLYLKRFQNIRKLLAPSDMNQAWESRLLDEATMSSLEFCAERLSMVRPEKTPPDAEVESLKQEVDSLIEQILAGNLNEELRLVLLDLLEAMRRAINEYRFRGVTGLRRELFLIVERLQEDFEVFKQNSNESEVSAFWAILARFDSLTSIYLNVPQVLSGFSKLLPGG